MHFTKLFGDPHQTVVFAIGALDQGHCYFYRFDISKDKEPVKLADLGSYSSKGNPFTESFCDWKNQRLILIAGPNGDSVVVSLKNGAVVCRFNQPASGVGQEIRMISPGSGNFALIGNRMIDLNTGLAKTNLPLRSSVCTFSPDGRLVAYATSEDGSSFSSSKLQVFDIAADKVIASADLIKQDPAISFLKAQTVHQIFFVDKDHVLVTSGTHACYIDHGHVFQ